MTTRTLGLCACQTHSLPEHPSEDPMLNAQLQRANAIANKRLSNCTEQEIGEFANILNTLIDLNKSNQMFKLFEKFIKNENPAN